MRQAVAPYLSGTRRDEDRFRWLSRRWNAHAVLPKYIAPPGPIDTISARPPYDFRLRVDRRDRDDAGRRRLDACRRRRERFVEVLAVVAPGREEVDLRRLFSRGRRRGRASSSSRPADPPMPRLGRRASVSRVAETKRSRSASATAGTRGGSSAATFAASSSPAATRRAAATIAAATPQWAALRLRLPLGSARCASGHRANDAPAKSPNRETRLEVSGSSGGSRLLF